MATALESSSSTRDGGLLEFRVALADMTQKPDVVVVQVAGPDDELRADVTGYDVELIR